MNICYVSSALSKSKLENYLKKYNSKLGQQAQKYNRLLIEGLSENGAKVMCISSRPINRNIDRRIFFRSTKETSNNVEYRYIGFINYPVLRSIFLSVGTFFRILRLKKDSTVICDGLNYSMSVAAQKACKIRGIKTVGIITDVPCHRPGKTAPTNYEKKNLSAMKKFDSYLLLTEKMNEVVNPEGRPYIVLEGHSDVSMKDVPNLLESKSEPRVCMYAGSLRSVYGIEYLVNGFIDAKISNAELHIYGEGDYKETLIQKTMEHSNVKYYGSRPNTEIVEEELKATLLVNPRPTGEDYTKYSFPSKNMEYMASGTPLLTTKLPGMPSEYYDYVYTIDREDSDGIKERLIDILSQDPAKVHKFGIKAKDYVMKEKNNVVQAAKVIEELL